MELLEIIEKDAYRDRAKKYLVRIRGELIDEQPITEEDLHNFLPSDLPIIELIKW